MASSQRAVGQRISFDGALCTIRYIGEVAGTQGTWLGVEWDDPSRGKHDGQHKGVRYFTCILFCIGRTSSQRLKRSLTIQFHTGRTHSPTAASFVRPTRPADPPQDFLSALHEKYASDLGGNEGRYAGSLTGPQPIVISGKVAEEVGFDKIRRKQSQLDELKIVILDGMRIDSAYSSASPSVHDSPMSGQARLDQPTQDVRRRIRGVCPKVIELDLSRNLFTRFKTVVEICSELEDLRSLKINGNRFDPIIEEDLEGAELAFKGVKELAVEETLLDWTDLCEIASRFPGLTSLHAGSNQLSSLSPIPGGSTLTSTLTSLNLEFNEFTSLSDIAPLTAITSLRNLHLKGNHISSLTRPSQPTPVFPGGLQYVDISYNRISTWSFVDALPSTFPGLTSLRIAHNPIYDNPDLDAVLTKEANDATTNPPHPDQPTDAASPATPEPVPAPAPAAASAAAEESYMLTLARLPQLRALNFSAVAPADRTNADLFYLSRIARQLAAAIARAQPGEVDVVEAAVLARHPRWAELCDVYGEPVVPGRRGVGRGGATVDSNSLEARLVGAELYLASRGGGGKQGSEKSPEEREAPRNRGNDVKFVRIPKSFDVYAVKGIVGRLFGLPPLRLRLVWETGEWDPVAGYDEEEMEQEGKGSERTGQGDDEDFMDSSDEEAWEAERERHEGQVGQDRSGAPARRRRRAGRWVKREVELRDGPRQFGYCVDGSEVRIRVEVQ